MFTESEGERISYISVLCIRRFTDKQLEKPANNTFNRSVKTSEIVFKKNLKQNDASILKQDPNAKRFKRTLIYIVTCHNK